MGKQLVNYLKFDLLRASLAEFAELAQVAKKAGATRVSLIVEASDGSPEASCEGMGVAIHPESEYVAIKVPTLDGTELWIMARGLQERVEKTVGFARVSIPMIIFRSESLRGRSALNPVSEESFPIQLNDRVTLEAGTGVSLVHPLVAQDRCKESVH
jgi:hypothetical protein